MGTKLQSVFVSLLYALYCRYEASVEDVENGVLRMHRTISSNDVGGYASHLPPDEVQMTKEEDIVYKKGVLSHASGSTSVKLVAKVAHNS